MNIFNRIIMIMLMLFLIVFLIVTIVNIFSLSLFNWSTVVGSITSYLNNLNPYILTTILSFVLVIALIILILECYIRKMRLANVSIDKTGKTMVSLNILTKQIRESLNNIEDMIEPKVQVIPKNDGIIINTYSKLTEGINIPRKTEEIREAVSSFASNNLGFKVLQSNYAIVGFVPKKLEKSKESGIITINKTGLKGSGQAIFSLSGPGGPHTPITLSYGGRGGWENLPFGSYTIIEAWPAGNVYNYTTELSPASEEISANNRAPIVEIVNVEKISEDKKDDKEIEKTQ